MKTEKTERKKFVRAKNQKKRSREIMLPNQRRKLKRRNSVRQKGIEKIDEREKKKNIKRKRKRDRKKREYRGQIEDV